MTLSHLRGELGIRGAERSSPGEVGSPSPGFWPGRLFVDSRSHRRESLVCGRWYWEGRGLRGFCQRGPRAPPDPFPWPAVSVTVDMLMPLREVLLSVLQACARQRSTNL